MVISIGSKIKELRQERKICQRDICCDILSQTILSRIENDKMTPSVEQLEHISKCLNMPVSYFLDKGSSKYTPSKSTQGELYFISELYIQKKYNTILELYEGGKLNNLNHIDKKFFIGMSYFYNELYKESSVLLNEYATGYRSSTAEQKIIMVENYATALNNLNQITFKNSSYIKSLNYLLEARKELENYKKINLKIYFVIIYNIGSVYYRLNKYNDTIKILEKLLNSNKDITFLSVLPNIHLLSNVAYYRIKIYDKSLKHIEQAIWLYNYTGQNYDAGECYLNYINCLRSEMRLYEALNLVEKLIDEYSKDTDLQNRFLVQKMAVLFNMKRFDDLYLFSKTINISELRKRSRAEFYFMLGHAEYIRKEYLKAFEHLKNCEKYMVKNMFYHDLSLIYEDLYHISKNERYKNKAITCNSLDGITNILRI